MRLRTPIDIGAIIRDRRTKRNLDQKTLAEKVGVSRQWLVQVEKGKPRAEVGLILRTLDALGIVLAAGDFDKKGSKPSQLDIDSIVDSAREKRK